APYSAWGECRLGDIVENGVAPVMAAGPYEGHTDLLPHPPRGGVVRPRHRHDPIDADRAEAALDPRAGAFGGVAAPTGAARQLVAELHFRPAFEHLQSALAHHRPRCTLQHRPQREPMLLLVRRAPRDAGERVL